MEEDEKTYSDDDFRRILNKAEDLANEAEGSAAPGASLSLSDMKAAAAEAGLDPALVERAAHLMAADSGGSMAQRVVHVLGWRGFGADLPAPVTQERAIDVLSMLRASVGEAGKGEATPYGLVWQTDRERMSVAVYNEGGGSRVEVSANPSRWLALSGWLGIVVSGIAIGIAEPRTVIAFVGTIVLGLGVAVGTWASVTSRARQRMSALLETVRRAMQSTAGLPAGPSQSTKADVDAEGGAADGRGQ